ncbi:hypothetical protein E2C01_065799 [Portunus trituberculatus]|uniref:Uncharacterized protein n=1 Tax=Portunus trituberculatus TaxID=210409 RepID=A0A5B7HJV0_PORTR|nr:hypothetical protein [Portunus trituberculatus]
MSICWQYDMLGKPPRMRRAKSSRIFTPHRFSATPAPAKVTESQRQTLVV